MTMNSFKNSLSLKKRVLLQRRQQEDEAKSVLNIANKY